MRLIVVVDYRVDVKKLREGYLDGLFGHFLVLNDKDARLLVQDEVPLVVERKREEFDFLSHFEQVALDFIFFVLEEGKGLEWSGLYLHEGRLSDTRSCLRAGT
jgi:hypothetical protein